MQTNLDRQITSKEDAKVYLCELATNNEAYHPDDSADTIIWERGLAPDANECIKMDTLMDACRDFLDPCEELLALAHMNEVYVKDGIEISGYDAYFIEDVNANGIDIHEYLNTSEVGDRFFGMSNELERVK